MIIHNGVKYYVAGSGYYMSSKGKYLHNEILPKKVGLFVDHINGDRLDNRRENLRYVTPQQNAINRVAYNSTKTKGVYEDRSRNLSKPYRVMLKIDGKIRHFGRYFTLEEAKAVADKVLLDNYGEFARL